MTKFMKCTIALFGAVLWAIILVQIDAIEVLEELVSSVCLI